jgi:hypothetical protein
MNTTDSPTKGNTMSFEQQALERCKELGFSVTVTHEVSDEEDNYCVEINTRQTRQSILGDHWICFDETCFDAIKDPSARSYATPAEIWEFICRVLETDVNECDSDCDECESW